MKTINLKSKSVENILKEYIENDADIENIRRRIEKIYLDDSIVGGVYFIKITHLGDNPIIFRHRGKIQNDMSMVKFGRADDFSKRWPQFTKTKFEVLWTINGDNCMEAFLKKNILPNFKKNFYTAKVKTLQTYFCVKGSPGITEWRIMDNENIKKIHENQINNLNYQEKIKELIKLEHFFDVGDLEFSVGNHKQKNIKEIYF